MKIRKDETIEYICGSCDRKGCKLWREYQTFLNHQELYCAECALKAQDKEGPVDSEGMCPTEWGESDQIGWLIPAVLTVEEDTFWGYSSCPPDRVAWWKGLPT